MYVCAHTHATVYVEIRGKPTGVFSLSYMWVLEIVRLSCLGAHLPWCQLWYGSLLDETR